MLMDRDKYGFDEHTLPRLIALMDSGRPDYRAWTHTGPTGYFLPSRKSIYRIRKVVEQAEQLCISDQRFESLAIGLADGPMIADFTWFGRLKTEMPPIGDAPSLAYRRAEVADGFRDALQSLSDEFGCDG